MLRSCDGCNEPKEGLARSGFKLHPWFMLAADQDPKVPLSHFFTRHYFDFCCTSHQRAAIVRFAVWKRFPLANIFRVLKFQKGVFCCFFPNVATHVENRNRNFSHLGVNRALLWQNIVTDAQNQTVKVWKSELENFTVSLT